MNELALFAGAGGGILGGKLLGWRTVCAVEIEDYPRRALMQRQDDGCLDPFPIWDDVRTFDGKPWRGVVDIVTGGFPCQDISAAGKGAGIAGERSGLWSEMSRIIGEVRPRFCLVENSPVLTSRGLGTVLGDLAALGYDARWGVLGAIHAGAPHKRERIWIVAESRSEGAWGVMGEAGNAHGGAGGQHVPPLRHTHGANGADWTHSASEGEAIPNRLDKRTGRREQQPEGGKGAGYVADADGERSAARIPKSAQWEKGESGEPDDSDSGSAIGSGWWESEPDVGRVAHGVAARVDRLKAIGNGQVPAVVRLAWDLLCR